MRLSIYVLAGVALAGCEKNLLSGVPDAAPDAPFAGDFSCANTPWPTTAPDPLSVVGHVGGQVGANGLGGVVVEVHAVGTDALLGQTTTESNSPILRGNYSVDIPTGGVAPAIYRKYQPIGYVETYLYDPMAEFVPSVGYGYDAQTPASVDSYYQFAGITPDPAKGNVQIQISDCTEGSAGYIAGATVDAPPGAKVLYDDVGGSSTNSTGGALILGVTPGQVDLTIHAGTVTYRAWPVGVYANAWTDSERKP